MAFRNTHITFPPSLWEAAMLWQMRESYATAKAKGGASTQGTRVHEGTA